MDLRQATVRGAFSSAQEVVLSQLKANRLSGVKVFLYGPSRSFTISLRCKNNFSDQLYTRNICFNVIRKSFKQLEISILCCSNSLDTFCKSSFFLSPVICGNKLLVSLSINLQVIFCINCLFHKMSETSKKYFFYFGSNLAALNFDSSFINSISCDVVCCAVLTLHP